MFRVYLCGVVCYVFEYVYVILFLNSNLINKTNSFNPLVGCYSYVVEYVLSITLTGRYSYFDSQGGTGAACPHQEQTNGCTTLL